MSLVLRCDAEGCKREHVIDHTPLPGHVIAPVSEILPPGWSLRLQAVEVKPHPEYVAKVKAQRAPQSYDATQMMRDSIIDAEWEPLSYKVNLAIVECPDHHGASVRSTLAQEQGAVMGPDGPQPLTQRAAAAMGYFNNPTFGRGIPHGGVSLDELGVRRHRHPHGHH